MTKIQTIKVQNLKAVSSANFELNGCSIIVTGANNSGKSSILKSITERIQSKKPDLIVKQGEKDGFCEWLLTDGCKIQWNFTNKTETLIYITADGLKVKTGVIEALQTKYFGAKKSFDIDKFINSTPKDQQKQLCDLLGIDFTQIDLAYKVAYDKRTAANSEFKLIAANKKDKPTPVSKIDIETLKAEKTKILNKIDLEILNIKIANKKLRDVWEAENEKLRNEIEIFNKAQNDRRILIQNLKSEATQLESIAEYFSNYIDFDAIHKSILEHPKPLDFKVFEKTQQPEYASEQIDNADLLKIEYTIELAHEQNKEFAVYIEKQKEYDVWVQNGKLARENAEKCDAIVKQIEIKKAEIIASAKMPDGFSFGENGLLYNGLELNKQSQSTSALYIAGLKLATMNLGELKSIHFDASFLDKNSLLEVEKYAKTLDLQLLIERPDFDGGEIKYQIIAENE